MPQYPYLTKSGKRGTWRYRRSVPAHLRKLVGKREILMSFNTPVLEEALTQYHFIAAHTEEELDWAQQEFEVWEEERAVEAEGGYTVINHLIPELLGEAGASPSHMCEVQHDRTAACERHYQWCKDAEQTFRYETTKRVNADPDGFWRGDIIALPMSQEEFYALPQFAHLAGTGDGYKYLLAVAYSKRLENAALVLKAKLATQDVAAVASRFDSCEQCARQFGLAFVETELRLINDMLTTDCALVPAAPPPATVEMALPVTQPKTGTSLSEAVDAWITSGSLGKSAWSPERRALCLRVCYD